MERSIKFENIRQLLNNYREQNNWSIPTLAKEIGMNDSSLQIILNGKRDITLEMIDFAYKTFGPNILSELSSNEREDKMIKDYLNPITRNEERLLVRRYCRENNTTIERIAKDHNVTPSVLSRMITREFSGNDTYYYILKNLGLKEDLEDLLKSRNALIIKLQKNLSNSKEKEIFLYNSLIMKRVLADKDNMNFSSYRSIKTKTPAIRNEIGNLGATLRNENQLHFSDMAKLLNCSPSTIQSMEASKIPFNIDYYNLLIQYGYENQLNNEIEKIKNKVMEFKNYKSLTKEERIMAKSLQNYLTKRKIVANKRGVKAKSLLNAIEETKIISELSKVKPLETICKEINLPISSIHRILQGKQIADEKFYKYLISQGYQKELLSLSNSRTERYQKLNDFIENNLAVYYKNKKESHLLIKTHQSDFYEAGTTKIKDLLSSEDYIFYKNYRTLRKCLMN
ncbi:MAG: helix-turn-helix transcriptional regulator [Erysipelotrichaceae bacterium]|nr:helix-turn-helix transcriptional regulator [Erysipelotrichaceae bacterium]